VLVIVILVRECNNHPLNKSRLLNYPIGPFAKIAL